MGLIKKVRGFKKERRQLLSQQRELLDRQAEIRDRLDRISASARRAPIYLGDRTLLAETDFGRKMFLDASDVSLTPHIAWEGRWEPGLTTFLRNHLSPGQVFVDIGANCGFFSVLAGHLVGQEGAVLAVEPQTRLADLIRKSFFVNGFDSFAHVLPAAIGEQEGSAALEKSDFLSGSASIPGLGPHCDEVETVPVMPLSKALEEAGAALGRALLPDVMKIDSEGYEWLIWLGASETFARCDKLLICLEFSPLRYHDMGDSPRGFLDRMRADGFTIAVLQEDGSERAVAESDLEALAQARHGHDDLILRKGC
jgi:FkbM family methyltransferase